jgi:RHS repeat-associated protein
VVFPDNPTNPPDPPKAQYEYTLRDHLGNSRVMVADKNEDGFIQVSESDLGGSPGYTEILQENHYYAFGLNMEGPWHTPVAPEDKVNRYQYNGKELNDDIGLGWYSYGAREYDPVIGRFTGIDPMAESFSFQTPYAYAANNPISKIDVLGLAAASTQELIDKVWSQGEGTYDNDGNRKVDNEYEVTTNADGTTTTRLTGWKGGDKKDYVTYKDANGCVTGSQTLDVAIECTSGVGTDYTQDTDPTPGKRIIHNSTPLVFQAILVLSGEWLLQELGGWIFGARAAAETSATTFKSVGAAGKKVFNPNNFKRVSESFLKNNGISDIHAFKAEWLGTTGSLKLFDVVKHTGTNELLIIRKSTQEVVERTYITVK